MTKEEAFPNQRIYERDKFKCRNCGFDGLKDFESSVSRGGSRDDDSNLVLACHACNSYKGNFDCNSFEEARGSGQKPESYNRDVVSQECTQVRFLGQGVRPVSPGWIIFRFQSHSSFHSGYSF